MKKIAIVALIILLAFSMVPMDRMEIVAQESATEATGQYHWPMFSHDQQRTGVSVGGIGTTTANLEWTFPVPKPGYPDGVLSSPILGNDGTIYIGSSGPVPPEGSYPNNCPRLFAINSGGSKIWECPTSDYGRIYNAPALSPDGSRIYVCTYESSGTRPNLFAIDTATGNKLWTNNPPYNGLTLPEIPGYGYCWVGASSPVVIPPDQAGLTAVIYVGATPETNNGKYYLFRIEDHDTYGSIAWQTVGLPVYVMNLSVWEYPLPPTPAVANDGTIYVGANDGALYAINPDGTTKWSFQVTSTNKVAGSPAVREIPDQLGGEQEVIYIGTSDYKMCKVMENPLEDGGDLIWTYQTIDEFSGSSPAIAGLILDGDVMDINGDGVIDIVFTSTSTNLSSRCGHVYAIDDTGTLLTGWSEPRRLTPDDFVLSTPALGWLPVAPPYQYKIFVGSCNGKIYTLAAWDGTILAQYATPSITYGIVSSPAVGPPPPDVFGASGCVFVASDDGELYAFCYKERRTFIAHLMTLEGEPYPFDVIISNGTWRQEFKNVTYIETEVPETATYTMAYYWKKVEGNETIGIEMVDRFPLVFHAGQSRNFEFYAIDPTQLDDHSTPHILFREVDADDSLTWHWDPVTEVLVWNITLNSGKYVCIGVGIDNSTGDPPNYAIITTSVDGDPREHAYIEGRVIWPEGRRCKHRCKSAKMYMEEMPNGRVERVDTVRFVEIDPAWATIRIGNVLHNDAILVHRVTTTLRGINGTEYPQQFTDPQYAVPVGNYLVTIGALPEGYIENDLPLYAKKDEDPIFDVYPLKTEDLESFTFAIVAENVFAHSSYSGLTHGAATKTISVNANTEIDHDFWGCFVLPLNRMVKTLTAYSGNTSYQLSNFHDYTSTLIDDYNIITVRIPPEMDGLDCVYTLFGDITADGIVNILDIGRAAKAFGTEPGDLRWDPICDMNYDFKVNILDLTAIAIYFGKKI